MTTNNLYLANKLDKLGDHALPMDVGVASPLQFSPTYQQPPLLGSEVDAYEVMKPSAPVKITGLVTTNDNVCYSCNDL